MNFQYYAWTICRGLEALAYVFAPLGFIPHIAADPPSKPPIVGYLRITGVNRNNLSDYVGDFPGREYKINASAFNRTDRHIRLLGGTGPLCDGRSPHVLYGTKGLQPVTVVARDNNGNKFAFPVFCKGAQKYSGDIRPSPGLGYRF